MWDCSSDDSKEMELKVYPIGGEPFSQYIRATYMQKHNVHLYITNDAILQEMAQSKC